MKNLINFFIYLLKDEWNRPKEKCILKSNLTYRVWLLITVIYVLMYFSIGFDLSKFNLVFFRISWSVLLIFFYLWVIVGNYIKDQQQVITDEILEERLIIPRLVSKISVIFVILGFTAKGPELLNKCF